MTTTYTDVFGTDTLPPSEFGYAALSISTNTTWVWPYNSNNGNAVAKINDITAVYDSLSLIFPAASAVSVGEDFLVRNVGSYTITLKDASGATVATVAPSTAKYFYLTNNTTAAGIWGVLTYGSGASSVDAAALIGYGIKAISASLNQAHSVLTSATIVTIDATYRAGVFNYTGGTATLPLPSASSAGADFFFLLKNSGTGTLTVNPDGTETIDGTSSIDVQPNESTFIVCSGISWITVGLGRSLQYNFTQLVYDVSSGTPFTLTAAEASNKLLNFIGSPTTNVVVNVPATVAVYYVYNSISTMHTIQVKTASGPGTAVAQGQRAIVICDGTNVVSAQSAAVSSSVSLTDGSVSMPALNFASKTNSGLFKYSSDGVGVAVNGSLGLAVTSSGIYSPLGVSGGSF